MDTKLVKTVKMHGPGISDPSKIVEADVPEADVIAYQQSGYKVGPIPQEAEEPVVYTEADAIAHNEGEDVTAPAAPKKGKAKK